jgi:uncharacterized membrane protein
MTWNHRIPRVFLLEEQSEEVEVEVVGEELKMINRQKLNNRFFLNYFSSVLFFIFQVIKQTEDEDVEEEKNSFLLLIRLSLSLFLSRSFSLFFLFFYGIFSCYFLFNCFI